MIYTEERILAAIRTCAEVYGLPVIYAHAYSRPAGIGGRILGFAKLGETWWTVKSNEYGIMVTED